MIVFVIFRHVYNMEGKSSTQNARSERFLNVYLPIVQDSEFEFFYYLNAANLPYNANGLARVLKYGRKFFSFF